MKRRCYSPTFEAFAYYGGRGIKMCPQWRKGSRDFISWALAAGWVPGLQIDRIDVDGPYAPENCRFVTRSQNQRNKRNTVRLVDGRSIHDVAEALGVSIDTVKGRLAKGMTPDAAVFTPLGGTAFDARFTVEMPAHEIKEFRAACRSVRHSAPEIIRKAMREYVKRNAGSLGGESHG